MTGVQTCALPIFGAAFASATTGPGVTDASATASGVVSRDAQSASAASDNVAAGGVGLATLAKDLTSWWSNLDKPTEQASAAPAQVLAKYLFSAFQWVFPCGASYCT